MEDLNKLSYKARIEWYKKRLYSITSEDELPKTDQEKFIEEDLSADQVISILKDIDKKAKNLEDRIDSLSLKLTIPIDIEKENDISKYVGMLDSTSGGEYLSYALYIKLLDQQIEAESNLNLLDITSNLTSDPASDSLFINNRIAEGLSNYKEITIPNNPKDNALERYANRYLNNISSWNEHDYQIRQILNFADNYLGTFPDLAYIPWSARRDITFERKEINSFQDLWKNFSDAYKDETSSVVGGVKGLAALRPNPDIQDITKRYITYVNDFFNGINEVFGFNYTADLLCCFFQWTKSLDLKTLKGIRALLQLIKTGLSFDFTDILNSIKDIINNIFRGLLLNQLMGLVTQIMQRLTDPIKKWINNPDPKWQKILLCLPIDELINRYLTSAIEYIEDQLEKLLRKLYKKYKIKKLGFTIKKTILKEQKQLGTIIKMLDAAISILEIASVCGTVGSPSGEEVQQMMANYGIGPAEEYEYPEDKDPNIYNSFIPSSTQSTDYSADSLSKQTAEKFDIPVSANIKSTQSQSLDDCMKKILYDEPLGVQEWFEDIKALSNGRQ